MKILVANPRGFCAGVERAISIVEKALKIYGAPIYVRHEIVHNTYVTENLEKKGVIFTENIKNVPDKSILILSAHGVSQKVRKEIKKRDLIMFDATCPLVTKVHKEVMRASYLGQEVILIGHSGHPEVYGTMGQYTNKSGGIYLVESYEDALRLQVKNKNRLLFVTQTTLSVDDTNYIIAALRIRFPKISGPKKKDICYATTNRQKAVKDISQKVDLFLVVGSKNSSNSNRLAEVARHKGCNAFLINDFREIKEVWIKNLKCIGITAGASVPDILLKQVIFRLQELGANKIIECSGKEEKVTFSLPKKLEFTDYNKK